MAWVEIANADNGNFESSPGALDALGYYQNWDIKEKPAGLSNYFSDDEESFKGSKSLYSSYTVGKPGGVAPSSVLQLVKELRFPAVANKFYRIRGYIRFIAPSMTNNADKESLILRLKANGALGANPAFDSFPNYIALSQPRFSNMTSGQWHKIEVQYKALDNGNIFLDLEQFFNNTSYNPNIFQNAYFNFDAVEFFEHDKLSFDAVKTIQSFKGANDAKITANFSGGSGDFRIKLFEQLDPAVYGNNVFNQIFQTTTDPDNPITTFDFEDLAPANYRVTIDDKVLGYGSSDQVLIAELASTLSLNVNKNDISTSGLTDGSIQLSATGDSGDYTFDISPKLGNQVSTSERNNLPPGTYTCRVTDNVNGEFKQELVVINDADSNLSLSLTKQNISIPGLSNGVITANAFGDTGVYAFSIVPNNGQQDNNIFTGLLAGTYDVTVEDLNSNATVTEQIQITEPAELAITIDSQTNNLCFESENGAVNLSVSGGTGPYTYLWNDGPTTLNRTGLSTGNHQLRITDSLGYSKIFTIAITSPPRIIINVSKSGQEVTVNITGGVPPYTALWSDGNTDLQRTLAIGSYVLQVTDDNGCKKNTTVEITDFKFYFSKNPVWLNRITDPNAKVNLSWDAVVKIEKDYNSGTFENLFTANHPALEDGSTVFDFSQILKGQLNLALPNHKGKLPYVMEGSFKRFFVESNEKYGEPPVAQTAVTTETFHILKGGLSREEFADGSFFSVFLDNPKTPFFSWESIAKNVYPEQPEYLAYPLVNIGSSQVKIKAEAFDKDNKLIFTKETDFIIGLQPYMLINFPVGFTQLGFNNIAGNTDISYYTVEALNQNQVVISEKKYYYLNWKTQNNRKYFIYENALGVWATIVTEGSISGSLEVEMEMVKSAEKFNYGASDRTEKAENKVLMQSYNYAAGNLLNEETFILADFIRSENVYEFTDKRWRPVRIEMGGDWFDNYEDSTPFKFSVMYEKDKNWTPDVYRRDNRKINMDEIISENPELLNTLKDYNFESTYNTWGLSPVNDDRISRSSQQSYEGSASAKFYMQSFNRMRASDGESLLRRVSGFDSEAGTIMAFDVTDKIIDGSQNVIEVYAKTEGKDLIDTGYVSIVLAFKGVDDIYYSHYFGTVNLQIQINNNRADFKTGWNLLKFTTQVLNKSIVQIGNIGEKAVERWAVFVIAQSSGSSNLDINEGLSDLPIYFDNVKVSSI